MNIGRLAEEIKYQDLLRLENFINLELVKRRIIDEDPSFNIKLKNFRLVVKKYCETHDFDVNLGLQDDYIDAALDCLQFGLDHGTTLINYFSDQDDFNDFLSIVEMICADINENDSNALQSILADPLFPKGQRLAEISYENDLKAGYRWWLGAKGEISEEDATGGSIFDEEYKTRWNAIRSGASLLEIPLRLPPIKLVGGDDYEIHLSESDNGKKGSVEKRIDLHLSLGWDVDGDRMLLDLLNNLQMAWFAREKETMEKYGILLRSKKESKTLAFDSNDLLNDLKKKVFKKTIKEDQVEPFFLGLLCWDENKRLGNLSLAINSVIATRKGFEKKPIDENMYDRINRCYLRIRNRIKFNKA